MYRLALGALVIVGSTADAHHHDKSLVTAHHHDAPVVMAQGHGHGGAAPMRMSDGPAAAAAIGPIAIEGAYARAATGASSAAYLILSIAEGDDTLITVASPIAARVELHTHTLDERGVARMREVPGIAVTSGSPTVLQPGGLHVMFMGLKQTLEPGETVPLTLNFEKAGDVTVELPVRGMAQRPAMN